MIEENNYSVAQQANVNKENDNTSQNLKRKENIEYVENNHEIDAQEININPIINNEVIDKENELITIFNDKLRIASNDEINNDESKNKKTHSVNEDQISDQNEIEYKFLENENIDLNILNPDNSSQFICSDTKENDGNDSSTNSSINISFPPEDHLYQEFIPNLYKFISNTDLKINNMNRNLLKYIYFLLKTQKIDQLNSFLRINLRKNDFNQIQVMKIINEINSISRDCIDIFNSVQDLNNQFQIIRNVLFSFLRIKQILNCDENNGPEIVQALKNQNTTKILELEEMLKKIENENNNLKIVNETITSETRELHRQADEMKINISSFEEKIKISENKNEELLAENENLKRVVESKNSEFYSLEDHLNEFKSKYEILENENKELKFLINDDFKVRIQNLEAENIHLSEKITEINEENRKMIRKFQIISEECRKLEEWNKKRKFIIDKQKKIIEIVQNRQNSNFEFPIVDLRMKIDFLKGKLDLERDGEKRKRIEEELKEYKRRLCDFLAVAKKYEE
ncbi:hypothetical protein DMUE_0260 [Dictyocoela muelleri]|nr:hypothetical protein DMUE_0260 [Dictyocoela muelleri]